MQRIRYGIIILGTLLCLATPAAAQVSVSIGLPHVSIGIRMPVFPELVLLPGFPVYYAPRVEANYFFYDGLYWVFQDDYWYASDWYDGPWWLVEPDYVPLFILRIPVRYYRLPPPYFRGWREHEPPRWGHRWGRDWDRRHRGWDRWRRDSAPSPAPLPYFQRQYSGDRYPRGDEQRTLRGKYYRYEPRDRVIREHLQPRLERREPAPVPRDRREEQRLRGPGAPTPQPPRATQPRPGTPAPPVVQPPQRSPRDQRAPQERRPGPDQRGSQERPDLDQRGSREQRPAVEQRGSQEQRRQDVRQQRQPRDVEREKPVPRLKGQGRQVDKRGYQQGKEQQQEQDQEQKLRQEQERERERDQGRERGRD